MVPTATIVSVTGSLNEGDPVVVTAQTTDPAGSNDTIAYIWRVNGQIQVGTVSSTLTFTPPDNGSYNVQVEVRDEDQSPFSLGGFASIDLAIQNVAPSINLSSATDANGNPLPGTPIDYAFNLFAGVIDPAGSADALNYQWSVRVATGANVLGVPLEPGFVSDPTAGCGGSIPSRGF